MDRRDVPGRTGAGGRARRRAEHLLEPAATAGAAKELRLFRSAGVLLARFDAEQRTIRQIHHRLQLRAAGIGIAGRLTFQSLVAASRLVLLADLEQAAGGGGSGAAPTRLDRGIRLERVSYTYPGADHPVLQEVGLTLPAGATVAIVGDNGAGTSTLVKLLAGLSYTGSRRSG